METPRHGSPPTILPKRKWEHPNWAEIDLVPIKKNFSDLINVAQPFSADAVEEFR